MKLEPTLSPRFIVYIRNYLMDRGLNPEPIFRECDIASDIQEEYIYPIPVHKIAKLFEIVALRSQNTCVGLNMAQQYHYESAPVIILAMLAAPSVEEGLNCLCCYDQYIDTGIETRFNPNREPVQFSAGIIAFNSAQLDQLNEYLLAFLVQILNTATRKIMPVEEVWFRHDCAQNSAELEMHFNAPVKFSQVENLLFFKREFLRERFYTSNNLLFDILGDALNTYFATNSEHHGFVDVVSREIMRLGGKDAPSMVDVANSLALSSRTLRRRLAEEDCSFQQLRNMARERQAKYYLNSTKLTLSEIAYDLGYSELSAFSRAFRSWIGETPQAYRNKMKRFIST